MERRRVIPKGHWDCFGMGCGLGRRLGLRRSDGHWGRGRGGGCGWGCAGCAGVQVVEALADEEVGEYLIRPSASGMDKLTITRKARRPHAQAAEHVP